jgi:hypothetical protein
VHLHLLSRLVDLCRGKELDSTLCVSQAWATKDVFLLPGGPTAVRDGYGKIFQKIRDFSR